MLSGAWNFRDVSDLKTDEGRCVGAGFLFRSSELSSLEDTGGQDLVNLGVTDIFDVRDTAEIERSGSDKVPDGIEVHVLPFDLRPDGKAPHEISREEYMANRTRYLSQVYATMPMLPGAMNCIEQVIKLLGDPDRRVLVHCAAGKDRTGWVVAVVLGALGVARDEVLKDYLESNASIGPLRAHMQKIYGQPDGEPIEISDDLLGVNEVYLAAAQQAMLDTYGSLEDYLAACRVTEQDLERLRARLLV
ncbi:MAG: protein-tyrosine-phosphatase [Gordonia sp.]|uniref:tyrosine-protein phosphatase n=1 Tax=Williamsia sp. 1138 TaxID=1903117 RepID=UPI000A11A6EB|nr:tyrosine-protein phosphatase [Williamsia sp. 1138]MBA4023162.1 protein-tyrosine-phosphatase [Gordonia sp. (in: high G+C Gram-positive bacteria)]OZG28157.1 phosphotyrosine protein phosphatase [Williamsia sp. 1138]